MKKVKQIYNYNQETGERSVKNVELNMVDTAGVLLEEGQKIWYARASKSAPAMLFEARIKKLTTSSVSLEYTDEYAWWRPEEPLKAVLTSGITSVEEGTYSFKQIAVIQ